MQGLIHFPGIQNVIGGQFTLQPGELPSIAAIDALPQANFAPKVGALSLRFGDVRLRFPSCAVESASLQSSEQGRIWRLTILDRRWQWRYGAISGVYNQRTKNGELDRDYPIASARELAAALLAALGETRFDVSDMPETAWPRVRWDGANPADQLARLCNVFACRICLGLDNRVRLLRVDRSPPSLNSTAQMNAAYGFTSSIRPAAVRLIGGPLKFQTRLKLEAVGLDVGGEVLPIARLSYAPTGGFGECDIGNVTATFPRNGGSESAHALAAQSVYRWYRIQEQAHGGLQIPGLDRRIESIDQLLPLSNELLETATDDSGKQRPRPAEVDGVFLAGEDGVNTTGGALYRDRFSLDAARGLVKFARPVVKLDAAGKIAPADLYLTTSYHVRATPGGPPLRLEETRSVPGAGASPTSGPLVIKHEEIGVTSRQTYRSLTQLDRRISNSAEAAAEVATYIDAALAPFRAGAASQVQYAGLVPVAPSGSVGRITWRVGGGEPAVTIVELGPGK